MSSARLGRGGVKSDRTALGVQREGAAQRRTLLLAVDLESVGARLRSEGDTAAGPDRRAARPRGNDRCLLAPRLGATAGDHRAGLRRGRAAPARRLLGTDALVHQRTGEARDEGEVVELYLFGRRGSEHGRQASVRTSTNAPASRAPSRAPASRFSSLSTATISGPSGWRLLPIWPGRRLPLNTRGDVADSADRAERVVSRELRAADEVVALDRPEKPLPLDVPEIFTRTHAEGLHRHRSAKAAHQPRRGTPPESTHRGDASAFFE